MIKIYSIKEVIEASNNILHRTKQKTQLNLIKKPPLKKKIIFKKDKPLILTEELFEEEKIIKERVQKSDFKEDKKFIKQTKQNKLIDELYLKFNKKIKKNTLKVIFELQREVSTLIKVKNLLEISNKQIKNKISNLKTEFTKINNINKILREDKITLNEKSKELTKLLNSSQDNVKSLKEEKIRLENDLKDKILLKEQINKLSENLKSSKDEIKSLKQIKSELEKEISEYKNQDQVNKQKIYDISEVENKNKFFQEENLRIGSELLEVKKKHDILKREIDRYEEQKSDLISKINSVNATLNDSNILTSVFKNQVEPKANKIEQKKKETNINNNIDEAIKEIFSNK